MTPKASSHLYEDIPMGASFSFEHTFSMSDGVAFASLTGDFNPLHVDVLYGEQSVYGKNVVHGMFVSGLASTICGMHCPGQRSLIMRHSFSHKLPVFYGETITVNAKVTQKIESIKALSLTVTIITSGGTVAVEGEVLVKVL